MHDQGYYVAAEVLTVIIQEYFWINWNKTFDTDSSIFSLDIQFLDIEDDKIFVLKLTINDNLCGQFRHIANLWRRKT